MVDTLDPVFPNFQTASLLFQHRRSSCVAASHWTVESQETPQEAMRWRCRTRRLNKTLRLSTDRPRPIRLGCRRRTSKIQGGKDTAELTSSPSLYFYLSFFLIYAVSLVSLCPDLCHVWLSRRTLSKGRVHHERAWTRYTSGKFSSFSLSLSRLWKLSALLCDRKERKSEQKDALKVGPLLSSQISRKFTISAFNSLALSGNSQEYAFHYLTERWVCFAFLNKWTASGETADESRAWFFTFVEKWRRMGKHRGNFDMSKKTWQRAQVYSCVEQCVGKSRYEVYRKDIRLQ